MTSLSHLTKIKNILIFGYYFICSKIFDVYFKGSDNLMTYYNDMLHIKALFMFFISGNIFQVVTSSNDSPISAIAWFSPRRDKTSILFKAKSCGQISIILYQDPTMSYENGAFEFSISSSVTYIKEVHSGRIVSQKKTPSILQCDMYGGDFEISWTGGYLVLYHFEKYTNQIVQHNIENNYWWPYAIKLNSTEESTWDIFTAPGE